MPIKETKLDLPPEMAKITPIPTDEPPPEKIMGYDIVPKLHNTIFIVANKGSGKTNAVWHILKNCINKNTFVYIFSNTLYSDSNWDVILRALDKMKVGYFAEDDTSELTKIIQTLAEQNKVSKQKKDEESPENKNTFLISLWM